MTFLAWKRKSKVRKLENLKLLKIRSCEFVKFMSVNKALSFKEQ
uniref:Uncharacterized protein n=1 Tax=Rhizophora mucronata TaxID=61149 RepID=A0A2P2NL90_RHIMU